MNEPFRRARSPEQQAVRRAEILDTARRMLDDGPLVDISLRELSREVGLAKSNVVRYFPTRETVFLEVLVGDWDEWLDDLEPRLSRPTRLRLPSRRHAEAAGVVVGTLLERPRLCELLAACPGVLERNVPPEVASGFKHAAQERMVRLGDLVALRVEGLSPRQRFEAAGILWALVAGAWPMGRPSEAVRAALADPALAAMRVDLEPALVSALTAVLDGLAERRD